MSGFQLASPLDFSQLLVLVALLLVLLRSLLIGRTLLAVSILPLALHWFDVTLLGGIALDRRVEVLRLTVNVGLIGVLGRSYLMLRREVVLEEQLSGKELETCRLRDSLERRRRCAG